MYVQSYAPQLLQRLGAAGLAALVTAALFLIMQSLIATDLPELPAVERTYFNPFMERPEPPKVEEKQTPEKPAEPETPPQWETPSNTSDVAINTAIDTTRFIPDTAVGRIDSGAGTSTIVPVFRIAPDYPQSALRRGIEGHVDLIFDVAASGRTENIRVLDAQPQGVFERAAIQTLAKWKYKAPVQDGIPYGQRDMTTRITFQLEQ
ncbi:energy transducer TonB [Parahaliea aestuarii]|uniref:Protein TonB n=1 Tax=Parahaliea aestuarii TaxID=1852021 RepID=A0A5C9A4U8_9GAMM|nr:energy transducer TonB [Parahaliea aestuarii]TXS95002.1 TonB family protein [Parahaliea aestuarii]